MRNVGQKDEGQDEDNRQEGDYQDKEVAPGKVVQQYPGKNRAEDRGTIEGQADDPHNPSLFAGIGVANGQDVDQRHHHPRPNRLNHSGNDHCVEVGRRGPDDRTDQEDTAEEDEEPAEGKAFDQVRTDWDHQGIDQHIAVDHPLDMGLADTKDPHEGWQGDVHQGGAEDPKEGSQHHDEQGVLNSLILH